MLGIWDNDGFDMSYTRLRQSHIELTQVEVLSLFRFILLPMEAKDISLLQRGSSHRLLVNLLWF
jgi:hypothetical protein